MCFYTIGKIYLVMFLLSTFQPDEYSSSDVDSIDDESSDGNVSPNEIRDIVEAKNTVAFKKKVTMEQFLEVERTSTSVSEQKSIESTCEKVNTFE